MSEISAIRYPKLRFGEFFSGPGGMSKGALMAAKRMGAGFEIEPVFAVDYHEDACLTYHENIHSGLGVLERYNEEEKGKRVQGVNTAQGDLPLVLNADVRNVQPQFLNAVNAFLFGFPCNDFSNAGERKGLDGEYGLLYKEGLRLIESKRPEFFVAENVSGLLHANGYEAFAEIMNELVLSSLEPEGHNYVVTPHLYKFEEYGVPQTRHRIILVGIRADIAAELSRPFMPPKPTNIDNYVTAFEALTAPYDPEVVVKNTELKGMSDVVKRRLKCMDEGENIWEAMLRGAIPEDLKIKATKTNISSIYKKLDRNKPAYTVVGSGGGGTHMYHWDDRPTTDRERARLQTFPDDFAFSGGQGDVRRQIGMAVPPLGASIIIEAVWKTINNIYYEGVEPNLENEFLPEVIAAKKLKREKMLAAKVRKGLRELAKKAAEEAARMPEPEFVGYDPRVEVDVKVQGSTVEISPKPSNDEGGEPIVDENKDEQYSLLEAAE